MILYCYDIYYYYWEFFVYLFKYDFLVQYNVFIVSFW